MDESRWWRRGWPLGFRAAAAAAIAASRGAAAAAAAEAVARRKVRTSEDILKRGQDRVRTHDARQSSAASGAILLLGLLAAGSCGDFPASTPSSRKSRAWSCDSASMSKTTKPGINYHLPYPIERVIKVSVLNVRRESKSVFAPPATQRRGTADRPIPDESLMLTGDENIVDIKFVVQWAGEAMRQDFAFNVRNPDARRSRTPAESAMREDHRAIPLSPQRWPKAGQLVAARDTREDLLQRILDDYNSGIQITEALLAGRRSAAGGDRRLSRRPARPRRSGTG